MNLTRNRTIVLLAAISVLGFGLRLYTAYHVFPAQGDAGHFVQNGIAFAHGVRTHISGFWALFPQIVAYGAASLGWDPLRSLQLFTVFCGSIVIFSSGALAWGLTRRPWVGVVCAMLVATNFSLIDISATGLSEPGYLACLLSGSALWIHSIASGRKIRIAVGMTILATALFFKPYETYIYFAICISVQLLLAFVDRRIRAFITIALISGLAFLFVWMGYARINSNLGIQDSSQTKVYNIVYGMTGFDSKVHRSGYVEDTSAHPVTVEIRLLRKIGPFRYLWHRKGNIARIYVRNLSAAFRLLNNHIFFGAFRMGLIWFVFLLASAVWVLVKSRILGHLLIPLLMALAVPMVLSISVVTGRWMVQCIPFVLMVLAAAFCVTLDSWQDKARLRVAGLVLALFAAMNAKNSVAFAEDKWRTNNLFPVAETLHKWAGEQDVIMTFGPALPVAFYRSNTFNYVEIPYAPVAETAQLARKREVDFIIYSDRDYTDYPIQQIAPEDSGWPVDWQILTNLTFNKTTRYADESETYTIIQIKPDSAASKLGGGVP